MKARSFLVAVAMCAPSVVLAETYYAVTEAHNNASGVLFVTIARTAEKSDCDDLLEGAARGAEQTGPEVKIRKSICTTDIASDYKKAFRNKPIDDAMYISYELEMWRYVTILYGIDESWLNEQGCESLVARYRQFDGNAQCVFGR